MVNGSGLSRFAIGPYSFPPAASRISLLPISIDFVSVFGVAVSVIFALLIARHLGGGGAARFPRVPEAARVVAGEFGPRGGIAVAAPGDPGKGSKPVEGIADLAVLEGEREGRRMPVRGNRDVPWGQPRAFWTVDSGVAQNLHEPVAGRRPVGDSRRFGRASPQVASGDPAGAAASRSFFYR